MPRHSPDVIELNDEERGVLESMARSYTLPYWRVVRAQMADNGSAHRGQRSIDRPQAPGRT